MEDLKINEYVINEMLEVDFHDNSVVSDVYMAVPDDK